MAIDGKTAAQPALVDREQHVAPGSGDSRVVQKHCGSAIDAPDFASVPLRCRSILRRSRWLDESIGRYKPDGGPDLATAVRTGKRFHDLGHRHGIVTLTHHKLRQPQDIGQ